MVSLHKHFRDVKWHFLPVWLHFIYNIYLPLQNLPRCHSDKSRGYGYSQFSLPPGVQSIKCTGQGGKTKASSSKEPCYQPSAVKSWRSKLAEVDGLFILFFFFFFDDHQWKQSWVTVLPARKGTVLCTQWQPSQLRCTLTAASWASAGVTHSLPPGVSGRWGESTFNGLEILLWF